MVRVIYRELLKYAICNMERLISHSRFYFLQILLLVQEQFIKGVSYSLIFVIRENEIFISVIVSFLRS